MTLRTGRVAGKAALVTGAAGGMGRAHAEVLAREGAEVWLADLDVAGAERIATALRDSGHRAQAVELDVTRRDGWHRVLERLRAHAGRLDILVNNAGGGAPFKPFVSIDDAEWDRCLALNLESVRLGCLVAHPLMRDSGGGAIVNVGSTTALVAYPDLAPYAVAKAAVLHLTRVLAVEYAAAGIRVNALVPGITETPLNATLLTDPAFRRMTVDPVPLRRAGQPFDMAYAVLYLASDEAAYVTGAQLLVDGGAVIV